MSEPEFAREQAPQEEINGGILIAEDGYLDPDTGERYAILPDGELPSLQAAEQAALFYFYNLKAIDRIDEQIARLKTLKERRVKRRDFLKAQYLGPLKLLFKHLQETTKFKGKSVSVGMLTVKFLSKQEGFEVADAKKVFEVMPLATRVTFDLTSAPMPLVRQLAALGKSFPDQIKEVEVLKTKVNMEKIEDLKAAKAITVVPAGEVWDLT